MAINVLDQNARDTGQRFAASPGSYTGAVNEIGNLAGKLQAQSPVPQMQQDTETKMKELFDFDQQLEGSYDPLAGQRTGMYGQGVVQHPGAVYGGANQAISAGVGNVGDMMGAIGQYKQLEGQALVQALNTVSGFIDRMQKQKDREYQMMKDEQDRAWEREKFEKQLALEGKKLNQPEEESPELKYKKDQDEQEKQSSQKAAADEKAGMVSLIDQILQRNTKPITGKLQLGGSNIFLARGNEAQTTKNLYDQLKSQLSLQNRQKLKGSGAISDFEMGILEKASSTFGRNQSDEDFRNTLVTLSKTLGGTSGSQGAQRIRVRVKSTGQTGTIPSGEFDPNTYERI